MWAGTNLPVTVLLLETCSFYEGLIVLKVTNFILFGYITITCLFNYSTTSITFKPFGNKTWIKFPIKGGWICLIRCLVS